MTTLPLKLTTKQAKPIVKATFPNYSGRKFKMVFAESIVFSDTNWGGGSRVSYAAVKSDGRTAHVNVPAPWANPIEGQRANIPADIMVVTHSIFCGQDCGITIYVNPVHAPKWIAAPAGETK